jgi:preprotein translocase subunit YajC
MIKFANYSACVLGSLILSTEQVFADTAAGPTAGISQFLVLGGFLLIFYLLIWRPQSKRAKLQRDLIQSIQTEDEVVTAGGMVGKVIKVTDQFVVLKLTENSEAVVQKQAISASLPKGTMKTIQ